MKRVAIAIILALMLTMVLGSSVVYAGAPDAIMVTPKSGVWISQEDVLDGPPDILVKTPHGAKPKDDIPR